MAELEFSDHPQLHRTAMIAAFAGWPDASEAATRAVRHAVRRLKATRFASIDPEEFYDFTEERPTVSLARGGRRHLKWPENRFYCRRASDPAERDLLFLVGVEPHLRWRRYTELIMQVVETCRVELLVTVGALLDAVPHTRPAPVTTSATTDRLGEGFEHLRFGPSTYEGPTGITSVLIDAMTRRGIPCASIWGHAPHYLQIRPNPKVTLALLQQLSLFLPEPLNLSALEQSIGEFNKGVKRALNDNDQVEDYVRLLEEKYDAEDSNSVQNAIPSPGDTEALIRELEEFLRRGDDSERGGRPRG